MRKLLVALSLLFMTQATSVSAAPEASGRMAPMDYVCTVLSLDCTGMAAPTIIYTKLLKGFRLYGVYVRGENRIFVAPGAPAKTVVHEYTHYVLDKLHLTRDRCFSEEMARKVADKWAGDTYDDSWRLQYRCIKTSK